MSPEATATPSAEAATELTFRSPTVSDGSVMHQLVKDGGVLEPNTVYCYLLLATHFAQNCLITERDGEAIGFIASYRPPSHPEAIFVWQIGVRPDARGQGLAKRMLHELVKRPANADVRFLEATVDPGNEPSCRLFRAFAREQGVPCDVSPGFTPEHFTPAEHPPEDLHRIGPLRREP